MNKLENLMELVKANELLNKKQEPPKKKCSPALCVLAVIGVIAAAAAIAYAVYRYLNPDYLKDFEDEFEDDFEDDEEDAEDDFFVDEGEN